MYSARLSSDFRPRALFETFLRLIPRPWLPLDEDGDDIGLCEVRDIGIHGLQVEGAEE